MNDNVNAVISELLNQQTLDAFTKIWPSDPKVAAAEAANIAELLTNPNGDEFREFLTKLIQSLIGTWPDPLAWLYAVSESGAFEHRRPVKPGGGVQSPSRAITDALRSLRTKERQLNQGQESEFLEKKRVSLCMLVGATLVMKLRQSVAPQAAIGPGWVLMQSIAEQKDKTLQRKLHCYGGDPYFRKVLYENVCKIVDQWIEEAESQDSLEETRSALWKSNLPVGVDVVKYFTDESIHTYLSQFYEELGLEQPLTINGTVGPRKDASDIKKLWRESTVEQDFSYRIDRKWSPKKRFEYTADQIDRLRNIMPTTLTGNVSPDQVAILSARAVARERRRSQRSQSPLPGDALENHISNWLLRAWGPPHDMRLEDASFFEEEACYNFLIFGDEWLALSAWQELGFSPAEASSKVDPYAICDLYGPPPPVDKSDCF